MSALSQSHHRFRTARAVDYALLTGAACLYLYFRIRPILSPGDPVKPKRVIRSRAREEAATSAAADGTSASRPVPYAPDVFPGARDVETAYGTIKAFEWGPEDGDKVLLLHGIGTPCVALGDMAAEFVARGCRVMLFDLFGRGYSDCPSDLPHDERLYTSQVLLVLASSRVPWTGPSSFHVVGYSLGGALAAAFAAYHANLLRSATFVCPGGLVRPARVSLGSRILYAEGLLPSWLVDGLARRRLEPRPGTASVDVAEASQHVDFDQVPVRAGDASGPKVGDVVAWQLRNNPGFVPAYVSTIRNAPIYGQHEAVWRRLGEQLALRRADEHVPGLQGGRICLILADRDPIVVKDEWIEDSFAVLGEDAVDVRVLKGGHEIAISHGKQVAHVAMTAWTR
ncbi:alpha/beta hydrolase [Metarhizium album ARSEF 1941]|uniref:Alpha/beta hydrolase n=1 Tax=Metarhizium album (strain ARSEF 1941) TaxID=1081103 RepID=A0A0B2WP27_METAS|nr:alpha/beta hydrolase [Metarhizium album ARSEF 1941]KHN97786.1 alpha/beta hydrolase [Metarhizium album ARSEF 1941]